MRRAGGGVVARGEAAVFDHEKRAAVEQRTGHVRQCLRFFPRDMRGRDVAAAAGLHGDEPVFPALEIADLHVPLGLGEEAILVGVLRGEEVLQERLLRFRTRDFAVAVGVGLEQIGKGGHRCILAGGRPAREVEQTVADHRRRAIDGGEIAHQPAFGTAGEVVGFHREAAGNDQLFTAVVVPDDRCRIPGEEAGARGFPDFLACRGVEREDSGVGFQIAHEDDEAIRENG